jgi:hypothetical protein
MDQESLRLLIRAKLEQGLLPYDSIPRVWGATGRLKSTTAAGRYNSTSDVSTFGTWSDAAKRYYLLDHGVCLWPT